MPTSENPVLHLPREEKIITAVDLQQAVLSFCQEQGLRYRVTDEPDSLYFFQGYAACDKGPDFTCGLHVTSCRAEFGGISFWAVIVMKFGDEWEVWTRPLTHPSGAQVGSHPKWTTSEFLARNETRAFDASLPDAIRHTYRLELDRRAQAVACAAA